MHALCNRELICSHSGLALHCERTLFADNSLQHYTHTHTHCRLPVLLLMCIVFTLRTGNGATKWVHYSMSALLSIDSIKQADILSGMPIIYEQSDRQIVCRWKAANQSSYYMYFQLGHFTFTAHWAISARHTERERDWDWCCNTSTLPLPSSTKIIC